MEENEYENVYAVPVNYTDSGKLFGGMVSARNAVEMLFLVLSVGFIEFELIPMVETVRIIVMAITLIPLAILAMVGIDGDSLLQYLGHIWKFFYNRRKLHYKEVGSYE